MGPRSSALLVLPLAMGTMACGRPPAIEGVYRDRSSMVASTCGPIAQMTTPRAAVRITDDGALAIDMSDIHFVAPGDGGIAGARGRTTIVVGDDGSDIIEVASCGPSIAAPSGPVVSAAVSGAVGGATNTASSTTVAPEIVGFTRHETLLRLPTADNVIRVRQTVRFDDIDVCESSRFTTVPARSCEVTRDIELVLLEACTADEQRIRPLRGDDAVFCIGGDP